MTTPEPVKYTIGAEDFDTSLLPENSRDSKTARFRDSVRSWCQEHFGKLGGDVYVEFDGDEIRVTWEPEGSFQDLPDHSLALLHSGQLREAIPYLQAHAAIEPNNPDVYYNLGMALSDLGDFEDAKKQLHQAVSLSPERVNALVALGVAYQRSGEVENARQYLERAVELDPANGYARRNLGAVLGNIGLLQQAAENLRVAYSALPNDQRAGYGLARCLLDLGGNTELQEADALLKKVIDIDPDTQIAEMARQERRQLASLQFRQTMPGVRPDAIFYCLDALQRFERMDGEQVQAIGFEIALLGRRGLDVNNPDSKYTIRSFPGNYSGLQLTCMMYVAFKQIALDQDIGFDLAKEYEAAQSLFSREDPDPGNFAV